jgi:hypothetical protein
MGKMREKRAKAGYVPGPFWTDSGRYWTVLDVIGRYLDHRFSWFDGISKSGGRVPQGPGKDGRDRRDENETGKNDARNHGAYALACREDFEPRMGADGRG